MLFETFGEKSRPAVLFFHAMGVTGASSEPVARRLQDRYFCVLPTSTVYCAGQKYLGKGDEIRQVESFLRSRNVTRLELVAASSIGADLALAFLSQTKLPVEHVFFDGGQFAQIGKATRRVMAPLLYLAVKSLYWSKGKTLKKMLWCDDEAIKPYLSPRARRFPTATCAANWRTVWKTGPSRSCRRKCNAAPFSNSAAKRSTSNTVRPSWRPIPSAIIRYSKAITTCSIRFATRKGSRGC